MDLIIRNGRTLEADGLVDLAIAGQRIVNVKPAYIGKAEKEIGAKGCLILPTFVEPHVHLDKALLAEKISESPTIQEAREKVREAKKDFTVEEVASRARRVLTWAISSGVTSVRSHVDVDNIVGHTGLKALAGLREEFKGLLDLQFVAFPQEGIVKSPGVSELLRDAVEKGADVMGGLPEAEPTEEWRKTHLRTVMEIAGEKGIDLDVHCDVGPSTGIIEEYAREVIDRGLEGRATADHLISLSYFDDAKASKIITLLSRARINVVANPCTMMVSGFADHPPLGRGVTRIKEIVRAGVNFSYGLDNIVDPYNPFGDFDALRNGWLLAYQGQLNSEEDMRSILRMNTYNAAKTLRLQRYGLQPGSYADLNVLDAKTPREALRRRTTPLYVIKRGRIIVENRLRTKFNFKGR